jgi:hypothetical protein
LTARHDNGTIGHNAAGGCGIGGAFASGTVDSRRTRVMGRGMPSASDQDLGKLEGRHDSEMFLDRPTTRIPLDRRLRMRPAASACLWLALEPAGHSAEPFDISNDSGKA